MTSAAVQLEMIAALHSIECRTPHQLFQLAFGWMLLSRQHREARLVFASSSCETLVWAKSCDPTTMLQPHQRDAHPCLVYLLVISLVVQHHNTAAHQGGERHGDNERRLTFGSF